VIILGAAPSIANGVITGVDYVPPLLVRAGRNIGARGVSLYRFVIAPASLPAIVAGLKQGWAFAWRSLMAGELLVIIAGRPAIGGAQRLAAAGADHRRLGDLAAVVVHDRHRWAGRSDRPPVAPAHQREQDRQQVRALVGELVSVAQRPALVGRAGQQPVLDQR